jgi:6-phosphogluconolactonase/glucosamine-6-phosphate isomerase/deaminase
LHWAILVAMKFITGDKTVAVHAIAKHIIDSLAAGKRVLWLVSGGSNVQLEVEIMTLVRKDAKDFLTSLTIMPMDERYGVPDHQDSNTQALRAAGFNPGKAVWLDILARDMPLQEAVTFYTETAAAAFANAQTVIGQFGMGEDGHVAGILPGSPACDNDASTIAGYEWSDYQRLTLTPDALRQVNVAFVVAFGSSKKKALQRLQKNNEPLSRLPAQLLYDIPDAYIYNDSIESEV